MYGFEELAMDALLDLGMSEFEAEREIEDFMNSSFYRETYDSDYEEDGIEDVEFEEVE